MMNKYTALSSEIAQRTTEILKGRGLEPSFSSWLLTQRGEQTWLLGILDPASLARLERYTDDATLHHLSAALRGLPVHLSNSKGLCYGFLLSRSPTLPQRADFPGTEPGVAMLGLRPDGKPFGVPWSALGHQMVAGMTGSGKSTYLRLLAYQAIKAGMQLLVADLDGATLPMLKEHPALLMPMAQTPEEAAALVERALGETDHRAALFAQAQGYPEDIDEYNAYAVQAGAEPLPRLLLILDEFNATMAAKGGGRGKFADTVTRLAWRGRKFGIHLIFAAQDFTKAVVGRVRDQVAGAVCFRVRSKEAARNIGCAGAESIPAALPGRGISDAWGPIQTFYLDKALLIEQGERALPLSDAEIALAERALHEAGGKMSIPQLKRWGMAERAARKLAGEWEKRGWVQRDPKRSNARYITPKLAHILSKRQSGQGASRA